MMISQTHGINTCSIISLKEATRFLSWQTMPQDDDSLSPS